MCNLEVVCFNLEEVQLDGMKMIGNSDSEVKTRKIRVQGPTRGSLPSGGLP